jgi:hypothetical protein
MGLVTRTLLKAAAVYLVLDVLLAVSLSHLDGRGNDNVWPILLFLWGASAALTFRRWVYGWVLIYFGRSGTVESFRRVFEEAEIPPPPDYDAHPITYLDGYAESDEITSKQRVVALSPVVAYYGMFGRGEFFRALAHKLVMRDALNERRRDLRSHRG